MLNILSRAVRSTLAVVRSQAAKMQSGTATPPLLVDVLLPPNEKTFTSTATTPTMVDMEAIYPTLVTAIQRLKHRTLDLLLTDVRSEHIKEMSLEPTVLSEEQQMANQQFVFASTLLATSVVLFAVTPHLVLLMGPFYIYLNFPYYKRAYMDLIERRKVTTLTVDTTLAMGAILYTPINPGVIVAGAMAGWIYAYVAKVIAGAKDGTRKELTNLMGDQPRSVWMLVDGVEMYVPFDTVGMDSLLVVDAGQTVPVDGVITDGVATIDQHRLTGEAQPVERYRGDQVFAATLVLSGRIIVRVEKTGADTAAAQIGQMLTNTSDFTASVELRGQEIANRAALPTLLFGLATLPVLGADRMLAILFSRLGYNMHLIGPLSVLNYLQETAHEGILIKDGRALEQIHKVDTVVFDKTGTLTLEQPTLCAIHLCADLDETTLLTYAATAEQRQSHPIARAILQAAQERELTLPAISEATYEVGYGIHMAVEDRYRVQVGSHRFMAMSQVSIPDHIEQATQSAHDHGHSIVYVAFDGQLAGAIELRPSIRPEAQQIVNHLHARGITTYIISGDREEPTRILAKQLGIKNYIAETLPEDKAAQIARFQSEGKFVCFIGDGINDAIALRTAQVSISLRGATSLATDTAQIIMMDQSLRQLITLLRLSDEFEANMQINLLTSVVPGLLIVGGAFAGVVSYTSSIPIYAVGLALGMGSAMMPRVKLIRRLLTS